MFYTLLRIASLFALVFVAFAAGISDLVSGQTNVGDVCPVITVDGPSGVVSPGENMTFTANVSGGASGATTYTWSVSAGTIVSGQGTPSIQVKSDRSLSGIYLTATVEVSNSAWMPGCTTTASETEPHVNIPVAYLVDEFRTAGSNCEEGFARLDSFYNELNNDPNAQGVIIVFSDISAPRSGRIRRRQLMFHTKWRRFDPSRVTFIDGPLMKDAKTQFWIVPVGAESPVPEAGEGAVPAVVVAVETKPYLYAAEYLDGIPGCSGDPFDLADYAVVLNTEPRSRGRIGIAETSLAKYNRKRREILAELKTGGVPATRITTVYKRVAPGQLLETTELWVIPPKQK